MPLPTPRPRESHGEFVSRCMGDLAKEFPEPAQRKAVCEAQWKRKPRNESEHDAR